MKYYKNRSNKFHINDEDATAIFNNIAGSIWNNPDITMKDQGSGSENVMAACHLNPFTLRIFACITMLIIIISSPVLLFILPKGIVIDEEKALAAKAMANRENYDVSELIKGSRDNTPICLRPTPGKKNVLQNDITTVDITNADDGYLVVRYTGDSKKVKLRITGPDEIVYTYNLAVDGGKDEIFPLQAGDGEYLICVYENLAATQYVTAFSKKINVTIQDQFLPFLYPNQYVDFNAGNQAIAYGEYLSYTANNDLEVVSSIYNALITGLSYDYEEAETVQSGYIPDIDEVLTTGKGICLDYAVLMTAMLRSQRIPTRMEVGYAGTAYHAWISTYIKDIGWINGMIHFDGKKWSLMDPTFASTTDTKKLASFIGDGKNYQRKYIY